MLDNIIFLILRRMRAPLLSLILVYAVSVLGMVLIPGQDANGNPVSMSFFHAFYFVSYTATTIGFGEIPNSFTDPQRLWTLVVIYASVIVWIYAIGTLLALLQDKGFQNSFIERRFARQVQRIREPFYLVCGYGDTGQVLVETLIHRHQLAVVIDPSQQRINDLQLQNLPIMVPALQGDSTKPDNLLKAGLKHPMCAGVAALTSNSEINLKVAVSSKLLHPNIQVLCRADSHEIEANMASFGTDFIIDPYDTFAIHLATAMQAPCLYLLQEWLGGLVENPLQEPVYPPNEGHWVVCGYGRFGKALYKRLKDEGVRITVIESSPDKTGLPDAHCITGWGTEVKTLQEADIDNAVGIVAGTDNDVNNLSIVMTAREINPDLFVVARQNQHENKALFEALDAEIVMQPSGIIGNRVRVLLGTPLLHEFLSLALYQTDEWACELISRLSALAEDRPPDVWELGLTAEQGYAVHRHLDYGHGLRLGDLLRDPNDRNRQLDAIPLLMIHRKELVLMPPLDTRLTLGDDLLFCSRAGVRSRMEWTLQNEYALSYVLNREADQGHFLSRLFRRWH